MHRNEDTRACATPVSVARVYATIALGALLTLPISPAMADWPMRRHDAQRTGTSPGRAALGDPTVTWRHPLGAALGIAQLTTTDTDDDGVHEVVFIEGGQVVARDWTDHTVWATPIDSASNIDLVTDLDGDGVEELVVTAGSGHAYLLSARDGQVLWRSPDLGSSTPIARVGEVDGDPLPELMLELYRSRAATFIEFTGEPEAGERLTPDRPDLIRVWWAHDDPAEPERTVRDYNHGMSAAFADLDGDGLDEVVIAGNRRVYVYRGRDGRKMRALAADDPGDGGHTLRAPATPGGCTFTVSYGSAISSVFPDGDGREGVLFSLNRVRTGRQLFAMVWTPAAEGQRGDEDAPRGTLAVRTRWWVDIDTEQHHRIDEALVDLDHDGRMEIVTGGRLGEEGRRSTAVRILGTAPEAQLGVPAWGGDCDTHDADRVALGRLPDAELVGVWAEALAGAEPEASRLPIVLTTRDATLFGHRIGRLGDGEGPPRFEGAEHFRLDDHALVRSYQPDRALGVGARTRPIRLPAGDASAVLLRTADGLALYAGHPDGVERVAEYVPDDGIRVTTVFSHRDVASGHHLVVLRSDGRLTLLDGRLEPVDVAGAGEAPIRVRTYPGATSRHRPALTASFDGVADELVVHLADGSLARLDARAANLAEGADVQWIWTDAREPTLWDLDGDVSPEVVAFAGDAVEAREGDGRRVVFRRPLDGEDVRPLRSMVPGQDRRAPGGTVLHVMASNGQAGTAAVVTLDLAGAVRWASDWFRVATANTGYLTPDDPDGVGIDDVFAGFANHLRWFRPLANEPPLEHVSSHLGSYPEWTMVVRGRAGEVTHLIGAGTARFKAARIANGAVREVWTKVFDNGEHGLAILDCPDGRAVAAGPQDRTNNLYRFNVTDGGAEAQVRLAGGHLYHDAEAVPPEDAGGLLGPPSGIARLVGGRPGVVIGSTDGHLYALDPCPAEGPELLWALDFGRAVGVPTFGDTDGDGAEELIVPVADGYLYGIDSARMTAPAWVHDLAGPGGGADVDATGALSLFFEWAPVAEALSYEYALLDADERLVTPFVATVATQARVDRPLRPGARYQLAVRAIGRTGASPEAFSDGVRWTHDPERCGDIDDDGFCQAEDCGPFDPRQFPGADEVCFDGDAPDGWDDDCDGLVDEGCPCIDRDQDGYCPAEGDCDDGDPLSHPAAPDHFADGVDQDCDGFDGPLPCDGDGDGVCPPEDCDDQDLNRRPGADELRNRLDDDCDGEIDEAVAPQCIDADADGVCAERDCADDDPSRAPGTDETRNGADDDCDGFIDEGLPMCVDADGDGACAPFDCADDDLTVRPGMPERRNGRDDDCDGVADEVATLCADSDLDGVCDERDCAAHDGSVYPGADESSVDGVDNDCDELIDEAACVPAEEVCHGGIDNDCDGRLDEGCRRGSRASSGCMASPGGERSKDGWLIALLAAVGLGRRRTRSTRAS